MSFYLYKSKPNLIALEVLKHYNKKIKNKYNPPIIETNVVIGPSYKETILKYLYDLLKDYFSFIFIIFLLVILLYIRYIEVNKKKRLIKK